MKKGPSEEAVGAAKKFLGAQQTTAQKEFANLVSRLETSAGSEEEQEINRCIKELVANNTDPMELAMWKGVIESTSVTRAITAHIAELFAAVRPEEGVPNWAIFLLHTVSREHPDLGLHLRVLAQAIIATK
jgi:hypothetical protein